MHVTLWFPYSGVLDRDFRVGSICPHGPGLHHGGNFWRIRPSGPSVVSPAKNYDPAYITQCYGARFAIATIVSC